MEVYLQKYTSVSSVILLNTKSENWIRIKKDHYDKLTKSDIKKIVVDYGLTDLAKNKRGITSIYLFVTHQCNLACDFCFLKSNPAIKPEYYFDAKKIMEYLSPFLLLSTNIKVVVTGGEPLLNSDIEEILQRLSEAIGKENIILQTNGILLNKEKISKISNHVNCIEMSVENVVKDKKFREGMEKKYSLLKSVGCNMLFSYVVDDMSCEELTNAIELADKYDAYFQMRFVEPLGNGLLNYGADQWKHQYELMKRCHITFLDYLIENKGYDRKYSKVMNNVLTPRENCGGYGEVVAIHPNGDVFPCGNILNKEMRVSNINESNYFDDAQDYYEEENVKSRFLVESKNDCLNCDYLFFCNGMCGAVERNFEGYNVYKEGICKFRKEMLFFEMFIRDKNWSQEEYYYKLRTYLCEEQCERLVKRDVERIFI